MGRYEVNFSRFALEDLEEVYRIIKNNPYSNIRFLIVENYMLFYTINDEEHIVRVEKIFHIGADWISKL